MRLDIERRDHGLAAADELAEIMAPLLGWDEEAVAAEKAAYASRVEQVLAAEAEATDAAAVAHVTTAI